MYNFSVSHLQILKSEKRLCDMLWRRMAATLKKKVRRSRHRLESNRVFGRRLMAPIVGEDPGELYSFMLLDIREPVPFPSLERDVYLRA
jgi:hypothetical protein